MKQVRLWLMCLMLLVTQTSPGAPPFSGTIFLDPDIITAGDPTTLTNLVYAGQGTRVMFDRRTSSFNNVNAYLFNARFNDGLALEVQVNPEFGSSAAAGVEADKYVTAIGRLPTALRLSAQTVWIHRGVFGFGGGNNNYLIHTGQGELYIADGILEETLVHEGSHTSLDPAYASSAGWLAAQAADPEFISTYARDNPTREDVAESFLTWLAIRHRSSRISGALSNTIATATPNRHAYFDQQNFELYPLVPAFAPTATVAATNLGARSATLRAAINSGNLPTAAWFVLGGGGLADAATPRQTNLTRQPYLLTMPKFDLLPGSNYHFHLVASNRLGVMVGPTIIFTTLPDLSRVEATVAGDALAASSANSPGTEAATNAIDNNVTSKYLNFDKLNAGMTITPSGDFPVRALSLVSAEDAPERDPSSFVLEGSSDGVNFVRIASNAVPAFSARHAIQSFALPGTNRFNVYRVLFPTVANPVTANSMQVAEVELLYHDEITSADDGLSVVLPDGAVDVRGVAALFDRRLDDVRKFELASIAGNTIVDVIPAAGATVLKGFELVGAADDFLHPERRPGSVTVAGSDDGTNYTVLAAVAPVAPGFNLQIQEFPLLTNSALWKRYRVTFGPPVSGDRLQVGEMRLFGEAPPKLAILSSGANVLLSWTNRAGYRLERRTTIPGLSWTPISTAPVLTNGTNTVTLIRNGTAAFFRLRNQ